MLFQSWAASAYSSAAFVLELTAGDLGHSIGTLHCHVSLVTCLLLTLLPREREKIPALGLSVFIYFYFCSKLHEVIKEAFCLILLLEGCFRIKLL